MAVSGQFHRAVSVAVSLDQKKMGQQLNAYPKFKTKKQIIIN
jgi:hypothetical protein